MTTIKLTNRRSANYTAAETECLLSHLEANPGLLEAKLGVQFKTAEEYNQAWEEVAEKVTDVSGYFGTKRSAQDLKRKWSDLKHRVKAKVTTITMEAQKSQDGRTAIKLSETDERVLTLMTQLNDMQPEKSIMKQVKEVKVPSLRVFSFQNDSNSQSNSQDEEDSDNVGERKNQIESLLMTEIKSTTNEDKKRRISEAFNASNAERSFSNKRAKLSTEEEQLFELCHSQRQIFNELNSIKDSIKKCQLSVEKLAILKRAELRLKCAKYGVEFDDLFD